MKKRILFLLSVISANISFSQDISFSPIKKSGKKEYVKKNPSGYVNIQFAFGFKEKNTVIHTSLSSVINLTKLKDSLKPIQLGLFAGFDVAYANSHLIGIDDGMGMNNGRAVEFKGNSQRISVYLGGIAFYKKMALGVGISRASLSDMYDYEKQTPMVRVYMSYRDIGMVSADKNTFLMYCMPFKPGKFSIGAYGHTHGIGPAVRFSNNTKKRTFELTMFATFGYSTLGANIKYS